jgi:hypothetical protein
MMELRWQGVAYLASEIFPIFEDVRDITNIPTAIVGVSTVVVVCRRGSDVGEAF